MSERRDAILKASATAIAQRGIRGLRVNDVAEVAGVSPGLLYYHFKDRIGLLEAALNYINDRARDYRSEGEGSADSARDRLTRSLLGEIQDRPEVVENSLAWNELRASAVYEEALREPLARTTAAWVAEIADAITQAQATGEISPSLDPRRTAVTMTALVEGLSGRWLCKEISTEDARSHLLGAIDVVMSEPTDRTTDNPVTTRTKEKR
ncbi:MULTISPECIES: TetR/AcrR family transcriptional regulator [Rhodococcus]|uniref:TetR/AcrR family transcriptional regulator n=1 Tax=Rhodococcus pseudokoreensis TaxID=2811421 RepID=A0A974ZUM7_9NOCA|nr:MULTISPECIES: TetR/AcrR family transcriptional regulator [Rhodococcus]MBV6759473.1 TetR/AcrR family transcriptional regulator [Rhodococcus opacus]QSE90969.1 TetR/AcrR family transcriptional regulator [Rhodococcus pseudokoreensis]